MINKDFLMGYGAGKSAGGGGGGENPNYTQVITGTGDNPLGDLDGIELYNAINANNANAVISLDATSLGFGEIEAYSSFSGEQSSYVWFKFEFTIFPSPQSAFQYNVNIDKETRVVRECGAYYYDGSTVNHMSEYLSLIPTTLTIYWHPMPES